MIKVTQMAQAKSKFSTILFDADNTLFNFDVSQGLSNMLHYFGLSQTEQDLILFKTLNKKSWREYEDGKITALDLQNKRFAPWALQLNIPASQLNQFFLEEMAKLSTPLDGAYDLLCQLITHPFKLGLVSNGFVKLHHERLKRTKFNKFFDDIIISEEVGCAKPDPIIFKTALDRLGVSDINQVLMVGDNINADIHGALSLGICACWYNPSHASKPTHIHPTYQIKHLLELIAIVS